MNNEKLLAVDLFSGAGGLSLGFLQTGQVQIVAAVENNKSAQKTYRRNHKHGGMKFYNDIKGLNYDEIIDACRKLGAIGVNLVFGGPPCQGFSNANRQKTELISTNNQLVKEYVKAIEMLDPDAFVMENVKAMKSSKHKFFYSSKDNEEIVKGLGLHPTNEKIALGKECGFTDELTEFLKKVIIEKVDLSEYTVTDKDLISRISHLGRKKKESSTYLSKTQNALNKLFPHWIDLHNKYWCSGYKEKWMLLGDRLQKQSITDSSDELYSLLNDIIQVQKILMKMHEIALNNIEIIDIVSENKNVYIEVQTYGVLDYLTAKFKKLGYKLNEDPLFLNAANFGAPQLRERLFLIGVKSKLMGEAVVELPKPIIDDANHFYTVKHAIEDLENIEPHTVMEKDLPLERPLSNDNNPLLIYLHGNVKTVNNHVMTETTQTALDRFKMLEPGQNFHHLDESLKQTYSDPRRTQNTVYLRLNYNTPSGTVLNVRKSMWIHPIKTRAISIREAARLQTFPDNFVFEGSKDSQYQQIGNAVPPLLGRAVAEQVLRYLKKPIKKPLASIIKPLEPVTNS